MKRYGIVILHPDGTRRLFGRVTRSDAGDIHVNWEVVEPQSKPGVAPWRPHASYHASGQLHSKSHNRISIKKARPVPKDAFTGAEPIEATNADRALSDTLPCVAEQFDDVLEIERALVEELWRAANCKHTFRPARHRGRLHESYASKGLAHPFARMHTPLRLKSATGGTEAQ